MNMNRAFDCLNSLKDAHENSYKQSLLPGNKPYNYLKNEFLPYLNKIKVITKNTLYCLLLNGLKQTIHGALKLSDDLFNDQTSSIKSVKTGKLNTDCLEQTFSTVRQRNGFNS